jgi:hypothetical protein
MNDLSDEFPIRAIIPDLVVQDGYDSELASLVLGRDWSRTPLGDAGGRLTLPLVVR